MEYTKEELVKGIKAQIRSSDNKAIHALMTVYANQEDFEKDKAKTMVSNFIGFSSVDAPYLTSLAEQYHISGSLSKNQIGYLKRIMPKYANQLLKQSMAKGNFEEVKVLNPKTNRLIKKYQIVKK